jgi:hypothetical protein
MGKFIDILFSLGEARAERHLEFLAKMYPGLLGPQTEEKISVYTSKSAKPVKSNHELKNLEPNAYHSQD